MLGRTQLKRVAHTCDVVGVHQVRYGMEMRYRLSLSFLAFMQNKGKLYSILENHFAFIIFEFITSIDKLNKFRSIFVNGFVLWIQFQRNRNCFRSFNLCLQTIKVYNNLQALQVANNFDFLASHSEVRLSFTFNGERRALQVRAQASDFEVLWPRDILTLVCV